MQRVEITGSNIKRIDAETVAPVEVITREEIERSGQPTIADVLRNLPANTGGSFGESFSNSFAPGAAGISLRGLGQKTTLVLINSRRVTGYGFAQNLQDTFVDLNSIPSSAVERVEILKDGASAIYGSDAIAGVVNIIMRRDYQRLRSHRQRRPGQRQERLRRDPDRRLGRPRHEQVQRLRRARLLQAQRDPAVRHRLRQDPRLPRRGAAAATSTA